MRTLGHKNISKRALIDPSKVILPPLYIKLGLTKQYVKALDKQGASFLYIANNFPKLSSEKVKGGIFVGPQIRQLMNDEQFQSTMTDVEKSAWLYFREVISKFLGNEKDPNYRSIVGNMLDNFQKLGCRMSIKVQFLHSHLDFFFFKFGCFE